MKDDLSLYEQMCSDDSKRVDAAATSLTRRVRPIAERFVLKNSGRRTEVDDIVQETVLAVWTNMRNGAYKPMPDTPLDAYLYRIVKNKWLKKLGKQHEELDVSTITIPDDLPDEHYRLDQLQRAFAQIEQACQHLLKLVYWEGYKMEEIAKQLATTEDAVKMRKYRCMAKLGTLIKREQV